MVAVWMLLPAPWCPKAPRGGCDGALCGPCDSSRQQAERVMMARYQHGAAQISPGSEAPSRRGPVFTGAAASCQVTPALDWYQASAPRACSWEQAPRLGWTETCCNSLRLRLPVFSSTGSSSGLVQTQRAPNTYKGPQPSFLATFGAFSHAELEQICLNSGGEGEPRRPSPPPHQSPSPKWCCYFCFSALVSSPFLPSNQFCCYEGFSKIKNGA